MRRALLIAAALAGLVALAGCTGATAEVHSAASLIGGGECTVSIGIDMGSANRAVVEVADERVVVDRSGIIEVEARRGSRVLVWVADFPDNNSMKNGDAELIAEGLLDDSCSVAWELEP